MIEFLQILYRAKFKKNQANPIEWFDTNDNKPRAIVQISPAVQANGVLVNYGDVLMYWVAQQELEKRGFSIMCLPREKADCERLKAQGAKLFLDCGGFIYSGSHHKALRSAQAASITAHNASCCKEGGGIAISAPQTFGPFPSNPEEDLNLQVGKMLNQFDLIYGRDPISVENLRQIDPDIDSKIQIAPDLAFLYKPESLEPGIRLLSSRGIDVKKGAKPILGLTLNRQLYDRVPDYLDTMEKVIEFFKAKDAQIVLIPHEHGRGGRNEKDDQFLSNYLAKKTKVATLSKPRKFSYQGEIEYIKAVESAIAKLDLLISGRFHVALRGLSEHVPTLTFSWSHKFEMIFQSLGMSPAEYVLLPEDFIVSEAGVFVCEKLEKAWLRRDETKRHLEANVPLIKQQVAKFLDEAVAIALNHNSLI